MQLSRMNTVRFGGQLGFCILFPVKRNVKLLNVCAAKCSLTDAERDPAAAHGVLFWLLDNSGGLTQPSHPVSIV